MFDEKNIVLSFGAVSDIHIGNSGCGRDTGYFKKALTQLAARAEMDGRPLDAVIGVGDLTDNYGKSEEVKSREIAGVKESYEAVLNPEKTPFVYVMGNHDHDFMRAGGAGLSLADFMEKMGHVEANTRYDLPCPDSKNGSRHALIGGYHFLFAEPITYGCIGADDSGAKFTPETLAWLDAELQKITAEEPEKYVFVSVHAMIYGTAYGSELCTASTYWYTKDIVPVLSKYPQVVAFGGHLHFPLNDPRSIMQTDFTAMGCGSVNYMAIENGGYEHMLAMCVTEDRLDFSQGLLCELDGAGALRITRMDFRHGEEIGKAWMLPRPTADTAHLAVYRKDRAEKNSAPVLSEMHVAAGALEEDGREAVLHFAAAADDEFAHHYVIEVTKGGEVFRTLKILADFYLHGDPMDMKKTWEESLGFFAEGKYEVALWAVDSWGAVSEKLMAGFEIA